MKYLLIGDSLAFKAANGYKSNTIQLSGLYQWANVFNKYGNKGDIEPFWRKEDLEDYDIVHINYTPSNIQLPTIVKQELKDSSTKIVMNVDLDITKWSPVWAPRITNMITELKLADIVFHVEPMGQSIIEQLIDSKVSMCPHPVDVSGIYDSILKLEDREDIISTIFHRYTGDTMTQYLAQKNIPLRKVLFGMLPENKKLVSSQGMYDQFIPQLTFPEFISEIAKSRIGCDLYDGYSYGRTPIELAALGIPSVVSNRIGSSYLFPNTTINPYDTINAHKLFMKLLTDVEFTNNVIKTAHERCSYYSLKNSFERFKLMIEDDT